MSSTTILRGPTSALNVDISGTLGRFKVTRQHDESAALEVRYMLTHIALSARGMQSDLLELLAPVREIFDLKELGFDEIMQRDIDDARVSLDLIPYLLDSTSAGLVKLFPPIVAVVLPLKANSKMPDTRYARVSQLDDSYPEREGYRLWKLTAGAAGEEQFQFEQLIDDRGVPIIADGARLRLANRRCALAIVDGQHRAMALLALYRNLVNGWDGARAAYQQYYRVWTDKEIRKFDFDSLQLPVVICTIPQLDVDYTGDMDVIRAARRVFLTLNKTARKVSDSRNKLLDDQDMVSECLRSALSEIKVLDARDETALRIWNIELDQAHDRTKVESEVAFSGVAHLYFMAENILLSNSYVTDLASREGRGRPRTQLHDAYARLGLKDDLTRDQMDRNQRYSYSDDVARHFEGKWRDIFVPVIRSLLSDLHAYDAHNRAVLRLHTDLNREGEKELLRVLFDGQATARTFEEFKDRLETKIEGGEPGWTSPELRTVLDSVKGTESQRQKHIVAMRRDRASKFLVDVPRSGKSKLIWHEGTVHPTVADAIDNLYSNVFSTVAFQTALVCTLTEGVERGTGASNVPDEIRREYIAALNRLFKPTSKEDVDRLVRVFLGQLRLDAATATIVPTTSTFRAVVFPGEMKPAEWPKYRYLILELWEPKNAAIAEALKKDREQCRRFIARALFNRLLTAFCQSHAKLEEEATPAERTDIGKRAKRDYEELLLCLTGRAVAVPLEEIK